MAISSLSLPKTNDMMDAMEVGLKLKKIRTTETRTTTIPDSYGRSGETAAAPTGTASTSKGNSGGSSGTGSGSGSGSSSDGASGGGSQKSGSILYSAASGLGLIK